MQRDEKKLSREEIIKRPGELAAKIIYNTLCDNDFELYYIGGIEGNVLYTVQLSNMEKALVAFTDAELLRCYINRKQMIAKIKNSFGNRLASVKISIDTVEKLIKQTDVKVMSGLIPSSGQHKLDTVIINPNMKDMFVPISITHTTKMLSKDDDYDNEPNYGELKISMDNVEVLEYDKKDKLYLFIEEQDMIG